METGKGKPHSSLTWGKDLFVRKEKHKESSIRLIYNTGYKYRNLFLDRGGNL